MKVIIVDNVLLDMVDWFKVMELNWVVVVQSLMNNVYFNLVIGFNVVVVDFGLKYLILCELVKC